ncbi:aldo/keto reductase [Pseudomaricurvus alkylphenolicus]|nr:aldo/keto reductase [Pseudomaricurvus alkylphenolicus]
MNEDSGLVKREDGTASIDKGRSREIYNRFIESGGNYIDTVNMYTDGLSEEFVGTNRKELVLSKKYSLAFGESIDVNQFGNSQKHM